MPEASAFLWNPRLLLQLNCRGYAVAQHMQPEPAKYSRGPVLEQQTFMLPEHKYFAHHPGRFVYVKDEANGEIFSVPYEPVRRPAAEFVFSVGKSDIEWRLVQSGLAMRWSVSVPCNDTIELWTLEVRNPGTSARRLSIYPCFSIGFMSWMNQAARYRSESGGIVASSVTPYQKLEDCDAVLALKDKVFLLHGVAPDAWEASQTAFEGEGGLHYPDGISAERLGCGEAHHETPLAALQYRREFAPGAALRFDFVFGPARDDEEIAALRNKYLGDRKFQSAREDHSRFLRDNVGCLKIRTPDSALDNFVNHWLDRQVFYHGIANRFCTDPQTRNYLQDHLGMVFVRPDTSRAAILFALRQQLADGAMPDGIILAAGAELKYINQVPHSDHSAWLPVLLQAYLDETNDAALLDERVAGQTVSDRVTAAMRALIRNRDARGLSLIAQGDWCDPMNMVGHKGRGVSGWLSMATVHALQTWAEICERRGDDTVAREMASAAAEITTAVQEYLWDTDWFARGITDDNRRFGVSADGEGRIFLNAQSWAMISGIASPAQRDKLLAAVDKELGTPYGMMTLAPAYTRFRDDVGRLTQKFPGTAENGAIYNHDAAFYVYALYAIRDADRAFEQLRRMIAGPSAQDYRQRGQLPVFVPNYYRGAAGELPRTAGKSSQLVNTGAASWLYRILVEELFGLKGVPDGLRVDPCLPTAWRHAFAARRFRGAHFDVSYRRDATTAGILVDGEALDGHVLTDVKAGRTYRVEVGLP
jgi:cellobionic acid phosphorylase